MTLDDLQKLPPQALEVIRFLAGRDYAAASEIAAATGLSDRAFGKAIRALVTRRLAEMPAQGVYRLSERGHEALAGLGSGGGDGHAAAAVSLAAPPDAQPASSTRPERRLSVLVAREWVRHLPAKLMVGFDAAPDGSSSAPQRLRLRVRAPGCLVEPDEHWLDIPPRRPAGPVQFRLTPHEGHRIRVRVEVYAGQAGDELLGGLYFEVPVNDLPTPHSAQFHALGAAVPLHSGA